MSIFDVFKYDTKLKTSTKGTCAPRPSPEVVPREDQAAVYPTSDEIKEVKHTLQKFPKVENPPERRVRFGAKTVIVDTDGPHVTSNTGGAQIHALHKRADHIPNKDVSPEFRRGVELLMARTRPRREVEVDGDFLERWYATLEASKAARIRDAVSREGVLMPGLRTKEVISKVEILSKPQGAPPRVVYQGSDADNLVMGAVTNEMSKRMAEDLSLDNPINTGNKIIYTGGMDQKRVAEINAAVGLKVEADFKNNDATQPAGIRRYEAAYYRKLGAPVWYCQQIMKSTEWTVFAGKAGLKVNIEGQRLSGECPTATGNTFVDTCCKLASLERAGVENSHTVVLGDDSLTTVFDAVYDVDLIRDSFEAVPASFGMEVEVSFPTLAGATFLRKRTCPYDEAVGPVPVPQFGRILERLPFRALQNDRIANNDYFAGKMLSLAYEHRFLPDIPDLLVEGAGVLSAQPYVEPKFLRLQQFNGPAAIKEAVDKTARVDHCAIDTFTREVYGVSFSDATEDYRNIIHGLLVDPRVNPHRTGWRGQEWMGCVTLPDSVYHSDTLDSLIAVDRGKI